MFDREKVIEALVNAGDENGVIRMSSEVRNLVVELLMERDLTKLRDYSLVQPVFLPNHKFGCPSCGVIVGMGNPYCWNCGKGIIW